MTSYKDDVKTSWAGGMRGKDWVWAHMAYHHGNINTIVLIFVIVIFYRRDRRIRSLL